MDQEISKKRFFGASFLVVLLLFFIAGLVIVVLQLRSEKSLVESRVAQESLLSEEVLGATDVRNFLDGQLIVNVPSTFNENVTLENKDLDAKDGRVFASNLIYSLSAGNGIIISGDTQNPSISADTNSIISTVTSNVTSQLNGVSGFQNIIIGNTLITSAQSNAIEFIGAGGISFSTDSSGRIVVTSNVTTNPSGFLTALIGSTVLNSANNSQIEFIGGSGITVSTDVNGRIVTSSTVTPNPSGFLEIVVGGTTIDSAVNSSIEFIGADGISFTADGAGHITAGISVPPNVSGFQKVGPMVYLQSLSDSVSLGDTTTTAKLGIKNLSDQVGLEITGNALQTLNLTEWKAANGDLLASVDATGKSTFENFRNTGDLMEFFGASSIVTFDSFTDDPTNSLANAGLEADLSSWNATTPSAVNQAINPEFTTNLNNWTATLTTGSYPEKLQNTGFEANINSWSIDVGNSYTVEEFPLSSGTIPSRIVAGPDGNMWFTITGSNRVGRISVNGAVTEYALPGGASQPYGITVGSDGNIWFTLYNSAQIGRLNPNAGSQASIEASVTLFTTGVAANSGPLEIITATDGNLWYVLRRTSTNGGDFGHVGKMNVSGTVLASYNLGDINLPYGIVQGPDGNIWVTESYTNKLVRLILGTGAITRFDMDTITSNAGGMTVGADNKIYIVDLSPFTYGVATVDPLAGNNTAIQNSITLVTNSTGGSFGDQNLSSLVKGADGNVWFGAKSPNVIYRLKPDGSLISVPITSANSSPEGLALGPDNNIWFVESGTNKIGRVVLALPARVTSPTFSGSAGAMGVPTNSNTTRIFQNINLGNSLTYKLTCYTNRGAGLPVNASHISVNVNSVNITSTYTAQGGDWYEVSASFPGTNALIDYGVLIASSTPITIDNCSLKQIPESRSTSQFLTSPASANLFLTSGVEATFLQNLPFLAEPYNLSIYVYNGGSPVTSAQASLYFNGAPLTTNYTLSGTPGWYQLTASFTPPAEGTYNYGLIGFQNSNIHIDSVSIGVASVSGRVNYVTTPTFGGTAGAGQLNAISTTAIQFSQSEVLTSSQTYTFTTRVYNQTPGSVGAAVDSSVAQLVLNGSPMAGTSYSISTGGFYQLQNTVFLSAGTYDFGVQVESGKRVIVDQFSLLAGAGENKTFSLVNSGSGLAYLNVESTSFLNAGRSTERAVIITAATSQSVNLVEIKNSSANILTVFDEIGRLGISTSEPTQALVVFNTPGSNKTAGFVNSNAGDSSTFSVLNLGVNTSASGTGTRFIQFYAGATDEATGTGVGRIRLNNGGVAYETGGADFAEYFDKDLTQQFSNGDVVAVSNTGKVKKSDSLYDSNILGVITDSAAFVGNAKDDNSNQVLVGLNGQVITKVSNLNGDIKAGDKLTSSTTIGYAMKATDTGMIIGIALEDFDSSKQTNCGNLKCGLIKTYVNPTWSRNIQEFRDTAKSLLKQSQDGNIALLNPDYAVTKLSALVIEDKDLTIKNGVINGNANFRSTEKLKKGQKTLFVSADWESKPAYVNVTLEHDSKVWVSDVTEKGFTINLEKPATKDESLYWLAIF